ncbi:BRO-N domain-containing protein [Loigolactobacillus zhaoyuanensis]|uniref:Bro-N domain-containing protein n=1 Tax=Loigolactobacillus zhaoyuanensis TaxID=2486017 RepID=A0ABW8U8E6_9LACO
MKTELWNNHEIRFVEVDGEWLAVAKDVSDALDYSDTKQMTKRIPNKYIWTCKMPVQGQERKMLALTEFGIYKAIFGSHKAEAEQFQEWVFNVIKQLRVTAGLEGFEIFRTLDKEHQRRAMNQLCQSLSKPVRLDFMKANTIANKAISTKFGYPKMVKKGEMTPDMLKSREAILEDTVSLMGLQDKYHMNLSISQTIYDSLNSKQTA